MGCNDVAVVQLAFNKSPQLRYRLCFDSATQDEHGESPSRRSLSPKSHRSRHLSRGCAALHSFHPSTDHE
jgi:hypothetical protein